MRTTWLSVSISSGQCLILARISVLETSYIIYLLKPHFKNFGKRLIKAPKLYFIDVGLACYLMDILKPEYLQNHPLKGALFETFVLSELLKERIHQGFVKSNLYYFRDHNGHEVDVLLDKGAAGITPIEIKMGKTIHRDFYKGINYYQKLNPDASKDSFIVYSGDDLFLENNTTVLNYRNVAQINKSDTV